MVRGGTWLWLMSREAVPALGQEGDCDGGGQAIKSEFQMHDVLSRFSRVRLFATPWTGG